MRRSATPLTDPSSLVQLVHLVGLVALATVTGCSGGEPAITACSPQVTCPNDLVCDHTGACVSLACPDAPGCCAAGETGCVCGDGDACLSSEDRCAAGICEPADCMPGREGCACGAGGCGLGLVCLEERCVDDRGRIGGSCFSDSTCTRGLRCQNDVCVPCTIGSQGCGCDVDRCNDGLVCHEGLCHSRTGLANEPPNDPECFTPCTSGGDLDGSYVECPASGLLPGCFGDTECVGGECVGAANAPTRCSTDVDCADFQACLMARCVSNCDADDQCVDGAICHRHVCRRACNTADLACPSSAYCTTTDGENGVCLPLDTPIEPAPHDSSFTLSRTAISFDNTNVTEAIELTHRGPVAARYFITKRTQRVYRSNGDVESLERTAGGSCEGATCPLGWLSIGARDTTAAEAEVDVIVNPEETITITFSGAGSGPSPRWEGEIDIAERSSGTQRIFLRYAERPEGRWSGRTFLFGNFGDAGIDAWIASGKSASSISNIRNALLQVWARFRDGTASLDELHAALISARTESWRSPEVVRHCPNGALCFPFANADGYAIFTTDPLAAPVPSGVVELPLDVNVRPDTAECAGGPTCYEGRIETASALQYYGNPRLEITFGSDPTMCPDGADPCVIDVDGFDARVLVGGQFTSSSEAPDCDGAEGFVQSRTPWLVTGFTGASELDPTTGRRYTFACRNADLPASGDETAQARNQSIASANPIRDGRTHVRTIEAIDGALVDGKQMIVIFRERTRSPFSDDPGQALSTYGIAVLERTTSELEPTAYTGNAPEVPAQEPDRRASFGCTRELLQEAVGDPAALDGPNAAAHADDVAHAIVQGIPAGASMPAPIGPLDERVVHYLCDELGIFDGGRDATSPIACPVGSNVRYFTLNRSGLPGAIEDLACQRDGTCHEVLERWALNGSFGLELDTVWRCAEPDQVYCSSDRTDLRAGKHFFAPAPNAPSFVPLRSAIDDAFRYRTRFVNRSGTSVGFVPQICVPFSNAVPYCYDPPAIERIRERVDCALSIENLYGPQLRDDTKEMLMDYLEHHFGYVERFDAAGRRTVEYGFEHLDTELLIMLGDDAYAKALASRFDLAGSQLASFEGDLFEPGGLQLSGAAGFELLSLYTAAQYYDLALSRFFAMSPWLAEALANAESGNSRSFITQATVVSYFDRLTRASTQKARAWSAIAERYQSFNRPDLARHVIERAYTAAHLEASILHHVTARVVDVSTPEEVDQIRRQIDAGQRSYRIALTGMQDRYTDIQDGLDFFGFSLGFVPFPALELGRDNAFEVALLRARQRMEIAKEAEQVALASDRSFESDAAAFQNELVRIRTTYESQLSELCGTMEGSDGRVYAAIAKYAYLEPTAQLWGDPCGQMGTGAIHSGRGGVEIAFNEVRRVRQAMANVLEEARIEGQRWNDSCDVVDALARAEWEHQGVVNTIQGVIDAEQLALSALGRFEARASVLTNLSTCDPLTCGAALAAGTAFVAKAAAFEAVTLGLEAAIRVETIALREIERNFGFVRADLQCDQIRIDGVARVESILLRLSELKLEALRAQYEFGQAVANVRQLHNQATRLQAEMAEMESLAINVEAARNNPNIRIYRNDAIINADDTFQLALREAYAATRVLEYYTSQSYAGLDKLFLTRMVTAGDFNLQRYIIGIEDTFREFEDRHGLPDLRLARLSLRDDILAVPRLAADGSALTEGERTEMLRDRLTDGRLLDDDGYLVVPFSTTLDSLSPLTRNHQIRHIEAEIIGSDVGDPLGRVYLRMAGTGVVAALSGDVLHYRFPQRTAVINPFFNGNRIYAPEVYQSRRLQSRPVVNSRWELIVNQRDEAVNADINLRALTDLRLYIYYSDFTDL